jgi:hypothetical protein
MNATNATSEWVRLAPVGRPNLQREPLGDQSLGPIQPPVGVQDHGATAGPDSDVAGVRVPLADRIPAALVLPRR